jgi:hypothetical protein
MNVVVVNVEPQHTLAEGHDETGRYKTLKIERRKWLITVVTDGDPECEPDDLIGQVMSLLPRTTIPAQIP